MSIVKFLVGIIFKYFPLRDLTIFNKILIIVPIAF